ncbi:hypothetical protein PV325_012906, partial [Microctonus aethiopoides]
MGLYVGGSGLEWYIRAKWHISDFKILSQVWNWEDGVDDEKSLQGNEANQQNY